MSAPSLVFTASIVTTKFWLVILPCSLFAALVLLVFTNALGDKSLDLTSSDVCGDVGEL